MCGLAGVFRRHGLDPQDVERVKHMNRIQQHRGPDDQGLYADSVCVLGHRRLAIIDLSSAGHQPFCSEDGRYQLIYNGEIYNYIELRSELQRHGWHFSTQTDTEVLLKAYEAFGTDCLSRFNGMFAFVIYDTHKQTLFMARDRVGIKPLYYYDTGTAFISLRRSKPCGQPPNCSRRSTIKPFSITWFLTAPIYTTKLFLKALSGFRRGVRHL